MFLLLKNCAGSRKRNRNRNRNRNFSVFNAGSGTAINPYGSPQHCLLGLVAPAHSCFLASWCRPGLSTTHILILSGGRQIGRTGNHPGRQVTRAAPLWYLPEKIGPQKTLSLKYDKYGDEDPDAFQTHVFDDQKVEKCSVADPGCLSRIRLFSIPDPNCLHPGSSSKYLSILTPKKAKKNVSKL